MSEELNTAANTEEVADPLEIDSTENAETPESLEGEETNGQEETHGAKPEGEKDFTTTKAFSDRLNEMSQKKVDAWFEKQYGESNDVHSEAEYNAALQTQTDKEAEEARAAELEEQGYDPSVIESYVNSNPTVKKAQEMLQKQETEKFTSDDYIDFLDYFKAENKREFDGEKDILPNEVWEAATKYQKSLGKEGRGLKEAYQKHENSILKARIAEYEKGNETNESNLENAATTTGSVTGNGKNVSTALTEEMVEHMTPLELSKRWKEVRELYKMT